MFYKHTYQNKTIYKCVPILLQRTIFIPYRLWRCCEGQQLQKNLIVDSSWNVMAHGGAREGKWRGKWPMEWVASTLHTTSEHGVSSITTSDAHTSAASSRLNWRPRRIKWTHPFRRKTKSGFCACAITLQLASTTTYYLHHACYHADYWMLPCNQTGQESGYRRSMQEGIVQDSFSVLKVHSIRNGTVAVCEATGYELTTLLRKRRWWWKHQW